ncbi:2-polyprenyl-6-methoxyphenol hydroxylase-like FAD-dependent oxidoreductase [Aminobacter lissarensis]|uniref:2-polyprenyl-6-methoxyphenol hydroxylase-like FAD-dependent oxidoreductase n=1 Tax=Aminobacter carboxidus TaxID=376165 RepID=A0A8E1WBR0_9HYPH|nr:NAD(P)/FAD-dependent oxidoreductase [Aminobacter lissarensis]MBB6464621.1 2-polyprenyl-6-methoxyphenol hydroxylase-like FAD-dependent oxidoreductase [Aminobacter lissarensis]
MTGRKRHVAIAGAGPAGLAAALYLARDGHRVTVYERFAEPKPVGSGLILQPTGLSVLADLGLFDEISKLGSRIDRLHGTDAESGRTVLDVRYDARPGGRYGVAVHRAALFGVLYRAALSEGIEIVTEAELDAVETGEQTQLVDATGRRHGAFDLVIDASGARSTLRRSAGFTADSKQLVYGAFWASLDWRGAGFDERALTQRYRRASVMIGVLPIGRVEPNGCKMAAFFWSLKPADAERVQAEGLAAWKAEVVALWPECQAYLDQIEDFDQLTLARYGHHTLPNPAARGFAVIGDAAHSTSPQLGQGANMALLDAAALAHALRQASDIDEALAAYVRTRRWHIRLFQMLSLAFTPFYQSDSVLLPLLRDRLVATVAKLSPAPQLLASIVAGTLIDPFAPAGLKEADWTERGEERPVRIPA